MLINILFIVRADDAISCGFSALSARFDLIPFFFFGSYESFLDRGSQLTTLFAMLRYLPIYSKP